MEIKTKFNIGEKMELNKKGGEKNGKTSSRS